MAAAPSTGHRPRRLSASQASHAPARRDETVRSRSLPRSPWKLRGGRAVRFDNYVGLVSPLRALEREGRELTRVRRALFVGLSWAGGPASLEGRRLPMETAANQATHGGEPAMFGT